MNSQGAILIITLWIMAILIRPGSDAFSFFRLRGIIGNDKGYTETLLRRVGADPESRPERPVIAEFRKHLQSYRFFKNNLTNHQTHSMLIEQVGNLKS